MKNSASSYKEISISLIVFFFLFILSPILTLLCSVLFYKSKKSYFFFIYFSFYFGWYYGPQLDLLNHYEHFKSLIGKPILNILTDSSHYSGHEPYPVLFKYLLGLISDSPNLFSACACMVYSTVFCCMLYSVRDLYIKKIPPLTIWVFCGIVFTVEFYWFLGLRYWTGAFVFILFYIKYIRTDNKKYLYLSFLSIAFHFAHASLCLAAIINELLKNSFRIRYYIIGLSLLVRFSELNFIYLISKLPILKNYVRPTMVDENIVASVTDLLVETREKGNQFYLIRDDLMFGCCMFLIFYIYRRNKDMFQTNSKLWGFILLLISYINFGYMDLSFYYRTFKFTNLLLFIYIFLYLTSRNPKKEIGHNLMPILIVGIVVSFAIITPIIGHREFLFSLDLWFNSWLFNLNI